MGLPPIWGVFLYGMLNNDVYESFTLANRGNKKSQASLRLYDLTVLISDEYGLTRMYRESKAISNKE